MFYRMSGFILLLFLACNSALAFTEGQIIDPEQIPGVSSSAEIAGIQFAIIGNAANITHGTVLLHGDGPKYYLLSILGSPSRPSTDRKKIAEALGNEGMVVAFPKSKTSQWSGFSYSGSNGETIFAIFAHIINEVGRADLKCHLGGMSGASLPLNSFLHYMNKNYGSNQSVTKFLDRNLQTVTDHDALCRPIAMQKKGYIEMANRHQQIRFNFIHGHGGELTYIRKHHEAVGKAISGDGSFKLPYHCPTPIELCSGRCRFWSASSHWNCFKGQIYNSIFGGQRPTNNIPVVATGSGNPSSMGLLGQNPSGPVVSPNGGFIRPPTQTLGSGGGTVINSPSGFPTAVIIGPNSNLGRIAIVLLGDKNRWREILVINLATIQDPNDLGSQQGTTINLPPPTPPATNDAEFNRAMPLKVGTVTSNYGPRWGRQHDGIDIGAPRGTPIYSTGDGVVIKAGWCGGYGNLVKVRHNDGTITYYAHCKDFQVKAGTKVKAGQQIATVNSTGSSTGNHLHFGVQGSDKKWRDPRQAFSFPSRGTALAKKVNVD